MLLDHARNIAANKIAHAKLIIITRMMQSTAYLVRQAIADGDFPALRNLFEKDGYQIRLEDCDLLMGNLTHGTRAVLTECTEDQAIKFYSMHQVDLIVTTEQIPGPMEGSWKEFRIGDRYLYSPDLFLNTKRCGQWYFCIQSNNEDFVTVDKLRDCDREKLLDSSSLDQSCDSPRETTSIQEPTGPRGPTVPRGPTGCQGPTGPTGRGTQGSTIQRVAHTHYLVCDPDAPIVEITWKPTARSPEITESVALPVFLVQTFATLYPNKKSARSTRG